MKLLLIDKKVNYYQLINSLQSDVQCILFESYEDTYASLIEKIKETGRQFTDVALVQHSNRSGIYTILMQEKPLLLDEERPYTSYTEFRQFLLNLKDAVGVQRFDMLACALYYHVNFREAVAWLETQTGIDLRASSNFTGNPEYGGDWVMESDNVDIRENYFTENVVNFKEILYYIYNASMYGANKVIKDICGNYRYLQTDICGRPINPPVDLIGNRIRFPVSSVVSWGNASDGGNFNDIDFGLSTGDVSSNVIAISSTRYAFAALKSNGSVVSWGSAFYGGELISKGYGFEIKIGDVSSNVVAIYSTQIAFAALKSDGSVVCWGSNGSSLGIVSPKGLSDVVAIYSIDAAFAALKSDGSVVVWGNFNNGGTPPSGPSNIIAINSTLRAFAALKSDGTVVAWGYEPYGGLAPSGLSNVVAIYSTEQAFAALKSDGSVVVWGPIFYGGDPTHLTFGIQSGNISSNVIAIYSTRYAFAALKSDKTVVTWGYPGYGGRVPSGLSDVVTIYSTEQAFAALKSDGSVVVWGEQGSGGSINHFIFGIKIGDVSSNVVSIFSTVAAFAALKSDGSVVTWGYPNSGGNTIHSLYGIKSGDVSSNVVTIFSTKNAFAALKSDGSIVTWGDSASGGNKNDADYGIKSGDVSSNIVAVYSTENAFAALKATATINPTDYYYSTGALKMKNNKWPQWIDGEGIDEIHAMTTDSDGNVYVVGMTNSAFIKINGCTYNKTFNQSAGFLIKYNSFGQFQWIKWYDGQLDENATSVVVDDNGNIYICITSTSPSLTTEIGNYTNNSSPNASIFIFSYNSLGTVRWNQKIIGQQNMENAKLIVKNNTVYISSYSISETVTINSVNYTRTSDNFLNSNYGISLVTLDSTNGTLQWFKWVGGIGNNYALDIGVDINSNVYIVGYSDSSSMTFNNVVYTKTSQNSTSFVIKYNSSGIFQLFKWIDGNSSNAAINIVTLLDESFYILVIPDYTSDSPNTIIIDGNTYNKTKSDDISCIIKFTATGTVQWLKWVTDNKTASEIAIKMKIDSLGNIYIIGSYFNGPFDITTFLSTINTFIGKYDSNGEFIWYQTITESNIQMVYDISIDNNNNVYIMAITNSNAILINGETYFKPSTGFGGVIIKIEEYISSTINSEKYIIYNNSTNIIRALASGGLTPYIYEWYETISGELEEQITTPPQYLSFSGESLIITNASAFKRNKQISYRCIVYDSNIIPQKVSTPSVDVLFIGYESNIELITDIIFGSLEPLTATSPQQEIVIPPDNQTRTIQVDVSGGNRPLIYNVINNYYNIEYSVQTRKTTFTYDLSNNYKYLNRDVILQYIIQITDLIYTIDIPFRIIFKGYYTLYAFSNQNKYITLLPPNSFKLNINVQYGTPPYFYNWYRKAINEEISTPIQSNLLNNINSENYNITSEESQLLLNKEVNYYVIVTDSLPEQSNQQIINYYINFKQPTLYFNIEPSENLYVLNYNNESLEINVQVSGGKISYYYDWVEKIGSDGDEKHLSTNSKFIATNNYEYVSQDVLKNYELYFKDSCTPPQERFYTFSILYKAYAPITATQATPTDIHISLNSSILLQINNISGGKSGNYIYSWYASEEYYDKDAILFSKLYDSIAYLNLDTVSKNVESINIDSPNSTSVSIYNLDGYLNQGHPYRIIYKCVITDDLNTEPIVFYFNVFFEALYISSPCIDGEVAIYTTNGLVKVKELNRNHIILNKKNNNTYPVIDIYVKEVDSIPSNNDSSIYTIPFENGKSETYFSTAIIARNDLIYDFIPTSQYAQYKVMTPEKRIMYHIFTNEFINRDIFTENGLQIKSYGSNNYIDATTGEQKEYLRYDPYINALYFNYLFSDTFADKELE